MGHRTAGRLVGLAAGALLVLAGAGPATGQDATPPPPPPLPAGEVITLGADAEVYRDDFSTAGPWAVGEHETGRIEQPNGTLRFTTTKAPDPWWNWWDQALATPVLWVRVAVDLMDEGGAGGPMCQGTPAPTTLYFGLVNTAGEWVVGRTQDSSLTVLARGPLPSSIDLTRGGEAIVAIECAVTGPSGIRIALWVDGINVTDLSLPHPMASFAGPGLYGEGFVDGFAVSLDDLVVAVGAAYAPLMRNPAQPPPVAPETAAPATLAPATLPPVPPGSPAPATLPPGTAAPASPAPMMSATPEAAAATEILSHVPAAFSASCQPARTNPSVGLLAAVQCSPAGSVDSASYWLYDSPESLEVTFEGLLAASGAVTDGTDCSVGPALVDYTIGGQPAGKLACYLDGDVAVALWTNSALRMMAMGAQSGSDFETLYAWWAQEAGPS
jgi:hypothetical protein